MATPELPPAFTVGVELAPGMAQRLACDLQHRLQDYLDAHDLLASSHHLTYVVRSAERSLTAADQVGLIDWLIAQPGVRCVRLNSPSCRGSSKPMPDSFVFVATCDIAVIGLSLLYRCGRISPELYLQVLSGFERPVAAH